ncbi:MAG: HDOD domain-containing protein [candidate division Zixibacteria bacterium]|nr:HDOD domain-containing protein [candidate division Zixibacteria bacterium]
MSTNRVLLVGGDQGGLGNLEQLLAALPEGWNTQTLSNSDEALTALDEAEQNIIVSAMQLPGMNGAELLKEAADRHPGVLRFLVSDQGDKAAIQQSAGFVHQFVAAPFEPDTLRKTLENSLGLHQILSDEEICYRIAAVGSLPSPPKLYSELTTELRSDTANVTKIADLISQDVGIVAKLLQTVNSAFFGLSSRVENISHAINLLGLDTVKSLVLSAGVFGEFEDPHLPGFSIEDIYKRSTIVGAKARLLAHAFGSDRRMTDDALLAGMLYDVGKLLMLSYFQVEYHQALSLSDEKSIPLYQAEREVLGACDATLGAYLLSLWGLPDSILEAVALHYEPRKAPNPMINATAAVHLAYATDYDETHNIRKEEDSVADMEYLSKIGVADQLPNLRYFCTGAVA